MALRPNKVRDVPVDDVQRFAEGASLRGAKASKERPQAKSFTLYKEEDVLVDSLCVKAKTRLTRTDVVRIGIRLMDAMTEDEFREVALKYRETQQDKKDD